MIKKTTLVSIMVLVLALLPAQAFADVVGNAPHEDEKSILGQRLTLEEKKAYMQILEESKDLIMVNDSPNVAFCDVTGDNVPEMFIRRAVSESEYNNEGLELADSYSEYIENTKLDHKVTEENDWKVLSLYVYTLEKGKAELLFKHHNFDGFVSTSRVYTIQNESGFLYYHTVSPEGLWSPAITYAYYDADGILTEYEAGSYSKPDFYKILDIYDSLREFSINGESVDASSFKSQLAPIISRKDKVIISDLYTHSRYASAVSDDEDSEAYDKVYKYNEAMEYLTSNSVPSQVDVKEKEEPFELTAIDGKYTPSLISVYVNDQETKLTSYLIEGYNYVALEDFAQALLNLPEGFSFNAALFDDSASITSGDGENTTVVTVDMDKSYELRLNPMQYTEAGVQKTIKGVNNGENDFFMLRELCERFGVDIEYNPADGKITLRP